MSHLRSFWIWVAGIAAIFAPIKPAVITALVLVLADLITGVWAAKKRGEPITSAGLKTTVLKIVVYEIAILLGYLAQTYLTGTVLPVSNLITSVIGLTESASLLENLQVINPSINFKSLISRFVTTKDNV